MPESSYDDQDDENLDDPEELQELLNFLREDMTLDQAREIRKAMQIASDSWLHSFIEIGGLKVIIGTLASINGIANRNTDKLRIQYELLKAVKAAMNVQSGLEEVTIQPELVALVALNLDSE